MHSFKYKLYCNSIVSEEDIISEIAYDIRLEFSRAEILNQIWFNEELQIQPKKFHNSIIKSKHDFL
jgi:hypothetical protein